MLHDKWKESSHFHMNILDSGYKQHATESYILPSCGNPACFCYGMFPHHIFHWARFPYHAESNLIPNQDSYRGQQHLLTVHMKCLEPIYCAVMRLWMTCALAKHILWKIQLRKQKLRLFKFLVRTNASIDNIYIIAGISYQLSRKWDNIHWRKTSVRSSMSMIKYVVS
jgi:hypothetical protein